MSYGPDARDSMRRVATIVQLILSGVPPKDIPIERPRAFYFVLNLKSAAQLGLRLPVGLVKLADEVITAQ